MFRNRRRPDYSTDDTDTEYELIAEDIEPVIPMRNSGRRRQSNSPLAGSEDGQSHPLGLVGKSKEYESEREREREDLFGGGMKRDYT